MYAVVKERTQEIGVKMALGARSALDHGALRPRGAGLHARRRPLRAPLIAIVIVTGLGFVPLEGNDVLEFLGQPTLSWPIGAGDDRRSSARAGLLAGYFPARRAAAIDPAATLRYE